MTAMSIILTAMGAIAMTDNDERAIKYEELPAEARSFIAKHFPNNDHRTQSRTASLHTPSTRW